MEPAHLGPEAGALARAGPAHRRSGGVPETQMPPLPAMSDRAAPHTPPPERTMRERMLAGDLYLALDPELGRMHARARRLLHAFNGSAPEEDERRRALLADLLGAVGDDVEVRPPFYCDYGVHISVGDRFFANYDCVVLDCNEVRIGSGVLFGPKVQVYTATHPLDPAARRDGWEMAYPITIGDDVWVGGGAILCPGVTIGAGSTVGAGSVVTRDVPAGVFAAGTPCRVIRDLGPKADRAGRP